MLKLDEHESNLSQLIQMLNVEGVDQAKVSTIIQSLRDNYKEVDTTITTKDTTISNIDTQMKDLKTSNMELLSKLGQQFLDMSGKNKEDLKNKQTQNQNQNQSQSQEEIKSLDDIANEFLK